MKLVIVYMTYRHQDPAEFFCKKLFHQRDPYLESHFSIVHEITTLD
jgi:hypothetical protein